MQVIQIEPSDRRSVRAFLKLPFSIYKPYPQWVPPLMPAERRRFKPEYAFYNHSEAAFFLVQDNSSQIVGRVAVLEHRPHNEYREKRDALVYMYEAIDDDQVARLLFGAAAAWAKDRELDALVGPKGFITGDGLGLLVDGFEHRPAIGIPYNPSYYIRQWEEIGEMVKDVDFLSACITRKDFAYPERMARLSEKIRKRRNFHVPIFKTKDEIKAYSGPLKDAYNQSFAPLWSYTPIPEEELNTLTDKLLDLAEPDMFKLIFKDDDLIGFQFVYPDISAAIQKTKGRVWPFGWISLLREKRRTKWLNINGNAILPQYQGMGANIILYEEMTKTILGHTQYDYADVVQVQENNVKMLADLRALTGAEPYKRHRTYRRELD